MAGTTVVDNMTCVGSPTYMARSSLSADLRANVLAHTPPEAPEIVAGEVRGAGSYGMVKHQRGAPQRRVARDLHIALFWLIPPLSSRFHSPDAGAATRQLRF